MSVFFFFFNENLSYLTVETNKKNHPVKTILKYLTHCNCEIRNVLFSFSKFELFSMVINIMWCGFELWCWRRLLRVPWAARRSDQSILKEISPEYSLVGLMLKLKLQYFGHLMQRTDSLGNTLMLGKIEGKRRRGQWRMRWLDGIKIQWTWIWASSRSWWWTGKPGCSPWDPNE